MITNNTSLPPEYFMRRCLELAAAGAGQTAPNPMVGAVLVFRDKIIGEGYHRFYGEPHAEVNCIESVKKEDREFISKSELFVSLEPCSHFGKTPPCTDLIIQNRIPRVIIGCRDPFALVDGRGIEKLKTAGIDVITGILEKECIELNKRFFIFHTKHRPYIILKWAQTSDGKINSASTDRLYISNEKTNRLVHKWRSREASILTGTRTALADDPELTNRLWSGPSPVRMVVDMDLKLPLSLKIFNGKTRTIIFNSVKHMDDGHLVYWQVTKDVNLVHQVVNALYQLKLQSVLVEGGAGLLQTFIDEGLWDETIIITNEAMKVGEGLQAPHLEKASETHRERVLSDTITYYKRNTVK